jgi:hypothetical protein
LEHVKFITDQIIGSKQREGTYLEVRIADTILGFGVNVQEINIKATTQRNILNERIRNTTNPEEKLKLKKEWTDSFLHEDALVLKEIYKLLSDGEFRKAVQRFGIDASFLPTR